MGGGVISPLPLDNASLPKLRVLNLDGDCVLDAIRVFQSELKEFGGAEHGVEGVVGGDGPVQHARDALGFDALPVGLDDLEVSRVLQAFLAAALCGKAVARGGQS